MQGRKLFSLEEANACVPQLAMRVERLQRAALRLEAERTGLAQERGVDPDLVDTADLLRARPAVRILIEELDALVGEIEETGAQLKDVRLGLVDFPHRRDGEVVLLCWQFGEPEVAFWHGEADGFAGRRPLPGAQRARWLQ
ncbi:MAG: DUF2203 domain-containing protein [bacterium]|nr:DUF2203 domain-containing protein [bacterium]